MPLDGNDAVVIVGGRAFVGSAEHESNAWAVDVAIAEARLGTGLGESESQIGCDGGFPDAAFSAGHGDDMLHTLDLRGADGSRGRGRGLNIDLHRNPAGAAHGLQSRCRVGVDFFCNARVICGEHQLHIDIRSAHHHIAEQTKRNDITRKAGVFDGTESLTNGILIDGRHAWDFARTRPAGKIDGLPVASPACGD